MKRSESVEIDGSSKWLNGSGFYSVKNMVCDTPDVTDTSPDML